MSTDEDEAITYNYKDLREFKKLVTPAIVQGLIDQRKLSGSVKRLFAKEWENDKFFSTSIVAGIRGQLSRFAAGKQGATSRIQEFFLRLFEEVTRIPDREPEPPKEEPEPEPFPDEPDFDWFEPPEEPPEPLDDEEKDLGGAPPRTVFFDYVYGSFVCQVSEVHVFHTGQFNNKHNKTFISAIHFIDYYHFIHYPTHTLLESVIQGFKFRGMDEVKLTTTSAVMEDLERRYGEAEL